MNDLLRKFKKSKSFKSSSEEENSNDHREGENLCISNTVNQEYQIAKIDDQLQNWTIPKVDPKTIYQCSTFNFIQRSRIKFSENNIPIHSNRESLNLFTKNLILKHREEFNYLHVGLVQVAVKPVRLGLDIPVLISLRDKRHKVFSNSLLGLVQSNVDKGPIYFNCYPNFTLSLKDPHILSSLMLDLQSKNLNVETETHSSVVIFRVYYKLMSKNISPRALRSSPRGSTTLIEANIGKSSVTVPKTLSWDQISRNNLWKIEDACPPKKIESKDPVQIIEFDDGSVEIKFGEETSKDSKLKEFLSSRPSTSGVSRSVTDSLKVKDVDYN